jgi:predicted ATPase
MKQTGWCVITGAPCSGKSAVVNELRRRGHRIVEEVARSMINEEMERGRSLVEIKADILAFERGILRRKLAIEAALPIAELIFLDRAIPDSIAYFTLEGLDPAEPLQKSRLFRYHRIFLFERLQFMQDPIRSENGAIATRIENLLADVYHHLGYDVVRIPVMPIGERADQVLGNL